MQYTVSSISVLTLVMFVSLVNGLTIKWIDSTTPKVITQHTKTPMTTTVSPNNPVRYPIANGPIVVLQHHGTLDGPSGRFRKTEFAAAPPVDLGLPPVFLPEFIPVHEQPEELYAVAGSNVQPRFEHTESFAAPPVDLKHSVVLLPEATPIKEASHEVDAAKEALYFVRG